MNYFLRFPEGKAKALTFSYDDGVVQDVRLIELFQKYGLKGTFNINGNLFEQGEHLDAETVRNLYVPNGQELACHGFNHPFLEKLPDNLALYEITEDRRVLEAITGKIIRGMAYPYGTTSARTKELLKTAGIAYARDIDETNQFGLPADWLQWKPTCHHNAPNIFDLAQDFLSRNTKSIGLVTNDGLLFYVWGHAYEFDRRDNWEHVEKLAQMVAGKADVWYATNMEIYRYITAYRSLEFSMDHHLVYNPATMDVWFAIRENPYQQLKLVCVGAGETICL